MYINDVIRQVKQYYPSEYDEAEMYIWCDEVSSMLAVEDRTVYKTVYISSDGSGHIPLPEGVRIENIYSVTADGKELEKLDFINGDLSSYSKVTVIYEEPYYPIRLPRYRGSASFASDDDGVYIRLGNNEFLTGDTINITTSQGAAFAESVPVLGKMPDPENSGLYLLVTDPEAVDGSGDPLPDCVITRSVTDETVCAAPYDSMYVDYILAKINLYQRDSDSYNRHMTAFNSRLAAYKKWLINHMPSRDRDCKFINVW